jgi:hypothetical protein
MNNIITIELCAEDRARLDRLAEALERKTCDRCVSAALEYKDAVQDEVQQKLAETMAKASAKQEKETPVETAENATEATEAAALPVTQPEEEMPAEPTVTLAQIQQKVVQLAAGFDGAKKAAVRAVINEYGAKVSDLKDHPDKWAEVWDKLTKLESEG